MLAIACIMVMGENIGTPADYQKMMPTEFGKMLLQN